MFDDAPQTRPSLLLRLRNDRDERAWSEFLTIYEPLLLRVMRRRGMQECDARDSTQQVLLRIYGAINRYQPDGAEASFRRWLFRVARNVAISFLSRQARQSMSLHDDMDWSELEGDGSLESDPFDQEYRQQVLAWALQHVQREFHLNTWLAFVETSVHGRDIADVARELNMSTGSVYVARSRVITRLRTKVEQFEADR